MNGKGSTRRPQQVSAAVMARNWALAFGKRAERRASTVLQDFAVSSAGQDRRTYRERRGAR